MGFNSAFKGLMCKKIKSSTSNNFIPSPVIFNRLGQNIFLSTLFSNSLSLHFSLNIIKDSHAHKTTSKTIGNQCSYLSFRQQREPKQEMERKATVRHKIYCILFQHVCNFHLLVSFPIILTLPHFQKNVLTVCIF
jgi:hypothetical protein